MRKLLAICLLASVPGGLADTASADDFAACAQSSDAHLKFTGCSHLIARDANLAPAYCSRAAALLELGQAESAVVDYTHAIAADPQLTVAYYNRGLAYLHIGKPDRALVDFGSAIAREPRDATAINGRGMALAALGRHADAKADFTQAISYAPDYARAYLSRASLALSMAEFEAAKVDFDKVLQLHPGDADALLGRSWADQRRLPDDLLTVASTSAMPDAPVVPTYAKTVASVAAPVHKQQKKEHHRMLTSVAPALAPASARQPQPAQPHARHAVPHAQLAGLCTSEDGQPCVVLTRGDHPELSRACATVHRILGYLPYSRCCRCEMRVGNRSDDGRIAYLFRCVAGGSGEFPQSLCAATGAALSWLSWRHIHRNAVWR